MKSLIQPVSIVLLFCCLLGCRPANSDDEDRKTISVDAGTSPVSSFEEVSPLLVGEDSSVVEIDCLQPVETMPEFPGGHEALTAFLLRHLQMPKEARNRKITGNVFVGFTIDSTGEVKDVQVLKGIGYGCDEEAVRVVRRMPRWKPGKQQGRTVPVRYTLPIRFRS